MYMSGKDENITCKHMSHSSNIKVQKNGMQPIGYYLWWIHTKISFMDLELVYSKSFEMSWSQPFMGLDFTCVDERYAIIPSLHRSVKLCTKGLLCRDMGASIFVVVLCSGELGHNDATKERVPCQDVFLFKKMYKWSLIEGIVSCGKNNGLDLTASPKFVIQMHFVSMYVP